MPILSIKALPQRDHERVQAALKRTCTAIAESYGCKPEQVWATWETLEPGCYLEGDRPAYSQPETTHPPIARLTCFEGKSPEVIERVLKAAAQTLSQELGIPKNIFITYDEVLSGRVIAGDGIVRRTSAPATDMTD